ncbi:MAG: transposase [Flavobacteriaceae bacterium]|nr:transposase [Flavobacteriaceae bacterium]
MKGYNYSNNNLYFVTICVQNKKCCFGNVIEGTGRDLSVHGDVNNNGAIKESSVALNTFGKIAEARLLWLEEQYEYVIMHSYIIMPNHVHAVIEIDNCGVLNQNIKIKSLSELVGAYKTTSSKLIHKQGHKSFKWQRSFHDHIIRNDTAFKNISNYIVTNANRWKSDMFFE